MHLFLFFTKVVLRKNWVKRVYSDNKREEKY